MELCYNGSMVPSSSGPGRLVLIQKIAGSTPAGITSRKCPTPVGLLRGMK